MEGDHLELRGDIREVILALDRRGILNSVASQNDYSKAMAKLRQLGLSEFFVCPQINWNAKSESVRCIAEQLNISLDTLVFVDDQRFELDEVSASLPMVRSFDADLAGDLIDLLDVRELPITDEATARRVMYQAEDARKRDEETFVGTSQAFLETLRMVITVAEANEEDLDRAEELTVRTNQLNSTGHVYCREELAMLRLSPRYRLLVVTLDDKYGTYGRVGLALLELREDVWVLKLLLMSCRVMSRGIGAIVLHHLMREAKKTGVRFLAEFVRTEHNRIMLITYRFVGFREIQKDRDNSLLEHDLVQIPALPGYIEFRVR